MRWEGRFLLEQSAPSIHDDRVLNRYFLKDWEGGVVVMPTASSAFHCPEARITMLSGTSIWFAGGMREWVSEHCLAELWELKTEEIEFSEAEFWEFPGWAICK